MLYRARHRAPSTTVETLRYWKNWFRWYWSGETA